MGNDAKYLTVFKETLAIMDFAILTRFLESPVLLLKSCSAFAIKAGLAVIARVTYARMSRVPVILFVEQMAQQMQRTDAFARKAFNRRKLAVRANVTTIVNMGHVIF